MIPEPKISQTLLPYNPIFVVLVISVSSPYIQHNLYMGGGHDIPYQFSSKHPITVRSDVT